MVCVFRRGVYNGDTCRWYVCSEEPYVMETRVDGMCVQKRRI